MIKKIGANEKILGAVTKKSDNKKKKKAKKSEDENITIKTYEV